MRLVEATEADQRARDRLTHAAWGERLSVDDFCRRELRLRAHPWAKSNMATWLLVDDARRPLASCETFRMASFCEGERGRSYGVASVFVEPELRRRGYAQRMMELVLERLVARDPAAHASILFSDVGPALYGRAGYLERPAFDLVWPAATGSPAEAGASLLDGRGLAGALDAVRLPDDEVVVWPTAEQLDWHLERARAYADLLGRPHLDSVGARAGASAAFWAADFKNERLVVLLLSARRAADANALIEAARRTAGIADLREVVLWDPPLGDELEPLAGCERRARADALPMIRPFDPRVRAEAWVAVPRALWI